MSAGRRAVHSTNWLMALEVIVLFCRGCWEFVFEVSNMLDYTRELMPRFLVMKRRLKSLIGHEDITCTDKQIVCIPALMR